SPELVGRGVRLQLVEETDRLASGVADAVRLDAPAIELLKHWKRDEDDVPVNEMVNRLRCGNEHARVDEVDFAVRGATSGVHPLAFGTVLDATGVYKHNRCVSV